ncbi:MAG: pseudouridine synthase, partial [Pseudomonadota bacterium]|nr:pseudouridine synthase [Pseudomonadota bacterium]
MPSRPANTRDVAASRLQLPPGPWPTVLDALCDRFPAIDRARWIDRMARGRVTRADGEPITQATPHRAGMEIRYWREVIDEPPIPFHETVLHADEHLVVADKPHFLPVTPTGGWVRETLLSRLIRQLDNPELVPLHRIDRDTAGLVLFSAHPASCARYQALFRERCIEKHYEALAPALPDAVFPLVRRTRLVPGEPFFRMQETGGEANSETHIDVIERGEQDWRYALRPVTGRKHQLRVHMAGLGAPIVGDVFYPVLRERDAEDFSRPLQLLANALRFIDPLSGEERRFHSRFAVP